MDPIRYQFVKTSQSTDGGSTRYHFKLKYRSFEWEIAKRFSDFDFLLEQLDFNRISQLPPLPAKTMPLSTPDQTVVDSRCKELLVLLERLSNRMDIRMSEVFRSFVDFQSATGYHVTPLTVTRSHIFGDGRFGTVKVHILDGLGGSRYAVALSADISSLAKLGRVWSVVENDTLSSLSVYKLHGVGGAHELTVDPNYQSADNSSDGVQNLNGFNHAQVSAFGSNGFSPVPMCESPTRGGYSPTRGGYSPSLRGDAFSSGRLSSSRVLQRNYPQQALETCIVNAGKKYLVVGFASGDLEVYDLTVDPEFSLTSIGTVKLYPNDPIASIVWLASDSVSAAGGAGGLSGNDELVLVCSQGGTVRIVDLSLISEIYRNSNDQSNGQSCSPCAVLANDVVVGGGSLGSRLNKTKVVASGSLAEVVKSVRYLHSSLFIGTSEGNLLMLKVEPGDPKKPAATMAPSIASDHGSAAPIHSKVTRKTIKTYKLQFVHSLLLPSSKLGVIDVLDSQYIGSAIQGVCPDILAGANFEKPQGSSKSPSVRGGLGSSAFSGSNSSFTVSVLYDSVVQPVMVNPDHSMRVLTEAASTKMGSSEQPSGASKQETSQLFKPLVFPSKLVQYQTAADAGRVNTKWTLHGFADGSICLCFELSVVLALYVFDEQVTTVCLAKEELCSGSDNYAPSECFVGDAVGRLCHIRLPHNQLGNEIMKQHIESPGMIDSVSAGGIIGQFRDAPFRSEPISQF